MSALFTLLVGVVILAVFILAKGPWQIAPLRATNIVFGSLVALWLLVIGGWWLIDHFPDYGRCLAGHSEPRHSDAWMEMRPYSCGKNCTSAIPIWHPAEDWTIYVCDRYEFPEGDGKAQREAARVKAEYEKLR